MCKEPSSEVLSTGYILIYCLKVNLSFSGWWLACSGDQLRVLKKSRDPVGTKLDSVPEPKISVKPGGHCACGHMYWKTGQRLGSQTQPCKSAPWAWELSLSTYPSVNDIITSLSILQKRGSAPVSPAWGISLLSQPSWMALFSKQC